MGFADIADTSYIQMQYLINRWIKCGFIVNQLISKNCVDLKYILEGLLDKKTVLNVYEINIGMVIPFIFFL